MYLCLKLVLTSLTVQHSGVCDVNPGAAVHMDSGETIAQWRKLAYENFQKRDHCP